MINLTVSARIFEKKNICIRIPDSTLIVIKLHFHRKMMKKKVELIAEMTVKSF